MNTLKCDMRSECLNQVTHIDNGGWIYCEFHGKQRKLHKPCRKLTKKEYQTIESGKQISYRKAKSCPEVLTDLNGGLNASLTAN